jgi:hypothetical protein
MSFAMASIAIPQGYVSIVQAVEWIAGGPAPLVSLETSLPAIGGNAHALLGQADWLPGCLAPPYDEAAPLDRATRLRLLQEAAEKLTKPLEEKRKSEEAEPHASARADLQQALVAGTLIAAALRVDGELVTMKSARWRMIFRRQGLLGLEAEPFSEALAGRTIPVNVTPDGTPTAWGLPIIALTELIRWRSTQPEAEQVERPTDGLRKIGGYTGDGQASGGGKVAFTIAAEKRLQSWIETQMRANPETPPGKSIVEASAKAAGHAFSIRGFKRAYANAVNATGASAWSTAGRKSKHRIETPDKS